MARLGPFEPRPLLAVAVSGGPDSMALALLAARWAAAREGRTAALLVDHNLRPEAGAEVRAAAAALSALGVESRIARIETPAPATGLPAWARRERYRLLFEMATTLGALHLLLAHHLDDQAETVLLNLARGSGGKGLAAMRPVRCEAELRLVRPLLDLPKARLAATAAAAGLRVVDDPSNRDNAYARARARQALAAASGVDAAGLARTADRVAADDAALEAAVASLVATAVVIAPTGLIQINRRRLAAAPAAVALRLLARVAHAAGGREAPPRQARAESALAAIHAGANGGRTLGGAVLRCSDDRIQLWREVGRRPPAVVPVPASPLDWDGRFRLEVEGAAPNNARIGPLGYAGLRLAAAAARRPPWIGSGPRAALATLPALWQGPCLLGLPVFGSSEEDGLRQGANASVGLRARFRPRRPIALIMPC